MSAEGPRVTLAGAGRWSARARGAGLGLGRWRCRAGRGDWPGAVGAPGPRPRLPGCPHPRCPRPSGQTRGPEASGHAEMPSPVRTASLAPLARRAV